MKRFRNIAALLLASALSAAAHAQDIKSMLNDVRMQAADAFVTVEYQAEMSSEGTVSYDTGVIEAQDDMWHLKGSFVELYTDGEATWVMDRDSKEVYKESVWTYGDLESFYNAALSRGASVQVKIISVRSSDKRLVSAFTPEIGEDWIVTDLR